MILGKLWNALRAQLNKVANYFWEADPIAQMRYEYDKAVEELKDGRKGLEIYRGLVERVARQVETGKSHEKSLAAKVKAYLSAGDRETASRFALELQKARRELAENISQLEMHEQAYQNNLEKIKHANHKLADVREKITKYDAELKMSEAEAEVAKLAESFDFNVTTDFGQIEQVIQGRIDKNRGKARVAADMSERGLDDVRAEQRMEATLAEEALAEFEVEIGLRTPDTVPLTEATKDLGPARSED